MCSAVLWLPLRTHSKGIQSTPCSPMLSYMQGMEVHCTVAALGPSAHAQAPLPFDHLPAQRLSCMQGMEVYSTVLWHMKQEVDLSHLAKECIALDRKSPTAWAVMGNCLSLQKVVLI